MKQVTKTTNKKKQTKLQQKRQITTTQKLAFIFVVAAIGAYLVSKSFASDLFNPNQIALMQDDTTKPYNIERVKTATGYEVRTSSQPFSVVATTQGDVYCAGTDKELRKVSVGRKAVKETVEATTTEITTTKAFEADTLSTDNKGESTMAFNGKKIENITVKNTSQGQRYKRKLQNIKNKCLTTGKKVLATKLPQFSLPPTDGKSTLSSVLNKFSLSGVAHAATSFVVARSADTFAENDQAYRIKTTRQSNNRKALYRVSCVNTISQNWAHWMAAQNKLYHNINMVSHIEKSCNVKDKWSSMGENVGYGPTSPAIFDAYMASAGHRANILQPKFTRLGVGAWATDKRLYTTQNFLTLAGE